MLAITIQDAFEGAPELTLDDLCGVGGTQVVAPLTEPEIRAIIDTIATDGDPTTLDAQMRPIWEALGKMTPGFTVDALRDHIIDRFGLSRSAAIGALAAGRQLHKAVLKEQAAEEREPNDVEILIGLADDLLLFHEPGADGEAFADVPSKGGRLTYPILSKAFGTWLRHGFYRGTGRGPTQQSMEVAISTIKSRAQFDGPELAVFVRVGWIEPGTLAARCYLDLGTDDGSAVEIDANGWRVVAMPAVRFRRSQGLLSIPSPVSGGSLGRIFEVINVRPEDRVLVLAWLIMTIHPRGAYPVLVLRGEQGSAKSTTAGNLKRLIDPGKAALRGAPKSVDDLAIAAARNRVLAFDNLSHISADLSDALCRLATPDTGGLAKRQLFTDADEVIFEATRPILINGIGDGLVGRSDLADRAIQVDCPIIPMADRRTDEEVKSLFADLHPLLLGAICDAVAIAIRNAPGVSLPNKSRMADFEVWSTAAEPAFGVDPETFLNTYRGNRDAANEVIIESSPVATAILELMAKHLGFWRGTPTQLHIDLSALLDDAGRRAFPKTPKTLTDAIQRLAPNLRGRGIEAKSDRSNGRRGWVIQSINSISLPTNDGSRAALAALRGENPLAAIVRGVPQPVAQSASGVLLDCKPVPQQIDGVRQSAAEELACNIGKSKAVSQVSALSAASAARMSNLPAGQSDDIEEDFPA